MAELHPQALALPVERRSRLRRFRVGFVFYAAVLAAIGGHAATPSWHWSNPEPHGNNITDLVFHGGRYVQVTDFGGVYVSTNRVIWERRETGTRRELRATTFLGDRLLVTGEEGTAFWSDDTIAFEPGSLTPTTTDWLEGVAASTNVAVAVGDNGAIYRSGNGRDWSRVAGTGFTEWLSGVAYGDGAFVAVGETGFIASSPNGTDWTRRNSKTTADLTRVTFGGGGFLVVGRGGVALASTNGVTWAGDGITGTTNDLLAASMSPSMHLAVGESAMVLLRPPSKDWTDQFSLLVTPAPAPDWTYVASTWDGTRFIASGLAGVSIESLQTNFPGLQNTTLWLRLDDSARNWLWDADRLGDTYLAVGDRATIMTSPAGTDWSLETSALDVDTTLYGVGGSPDLAVAVGVRGTIVTSPALFTNVFATNLVVAGGRTNVLVTTNVQSLLGIRWGLVSPSPTTNTLQGIAWNGSRFVAVGAAGTVVRSADGVNWSAGRIPSTAFFSTVAPFHGGWVAGGSEGSLYSSPDAETWTSMDLGLTNWVYRVRAIDDALVAVGQGGLILVSTDGTHWVSRDSGTSLWLTDVRRVGPAYYVSGVHGLVLRSSDLITWDPVDLPTGKALYALATEGAQLIAAGADGAILRSAIEPTAAPIRIRQFAHRVDASPPVDLFLFQGAPEQAFRLEGATKLGSWETIEHLQLGPNGSALLGVEAGEVRRFYRTVVGP